ncbi:DUF7402 domain-containing protein [Cohnella silvisoli]|uniref:Discoidin domain-containing protein n=1 Tax=Cohnella silvisoli TaxID=2873699 RepID=A0ABV1L1R6_9BACL|nr:discoidin domain-containing protein [Cohnella silvisoli]MCD9025392.1 discoidin domain-containing protein [Cohnella silvisoli]
MQNTVLIQEIQKRKGEILMKNKNNYFFTKKYFIALVLVACMLFSIVPIVSATTAKTISVDFSIDKGAMHPKTGWLLMPNADVPDGRITPLKTPIVRTDIDTMAITGLIALTPAEFVAEEYSRLARMKGTYNRANDLNIKYYPIMAYNPSWLSANGDPFSVPNDYSLWKQWIKDNVQYAKDNNMNNIPAWDIWNEYWRLNESQYNEMYKQAWNAIKEVMPNAKVAGNSNFKYDYTKFTNFANNVYSNGQTIDTAAWHEFGATTDILGNINSIKSYAATKPGIGIKQYYIEEYLPSATTKSAGDLVNWFAGLEDANVDEASKACFVQCFAMSDLLKLNNAASNIAARESTWWAMKAYAEMSGTKVQVTQAGSGTTAVAAKDTALGEAKILVGNKGADTVSLTLNLNNQPFAGQGIRIEKYQVTNTENDGLVLQTTETPSSTTNLSTSLTMAPDDVWLVVIKKTASAPGSFVLKTPDDQGVATTTPTLTWQAASGATSYNIKVSANKDMSSPIINNTATTNSYNISTALTSGTKYYWTVTAVNSNGSTNAANNMKYSFTASSSLSIPGGFTMLLASDGAVGTDTNPQFTWSSSAGATSYTLVVDDNSNFSSPEINQTGLVGTKIEAESGSTSGSAATYTDAAASGGTGVGYLTSVGDSLTFNNVPASSHVMVRYASNNKDGTDSISGTFSLYKNGTKVSSTVFYSTGAWGGANAYQEQIIPVTVAAGDTLKFQHDSGDVALNIDYISVDSSAQPSLNNDTTYYSKVIAVNASGSRDMNGSVHVFKTKPSGNNPGSFTLNSPVNATTNFSKRGNLSWSESNGGFFYKLEIATDSGFSNIVLSRPKIIATSYTLEPDVLSANTQYYWRVTASSKDGTYSTPASNNGLSFTTESKPTSPLLKTIDESDGRVTLYFNTVSNATSYKIKYGTSPGVYTSTISGVTGSNYTVFGLTNGTPYYFAVVANNANGDSDIFNEFSATPKSGLKANLAAVATASASSSFNSSYTPGKATDYSFAGEWASQGEQNPWIQFNWSASQTIDTIVLYDRLNLIDNANSGTLTFSDGSSIPVTGIPADGSAKTISFTPKNVTWVKFTVSGGIGLNVGLSEFQAYKTPFVTASSFFQNNPAYNPTNVQDGSTTMEWASNSELNPWIRLDWGTTANTINRIALYDRITVDNANGGTLTFSDGSTITVTGIPTNGAPKVITFPAKTVTSVTFQVVGGSGYNVGLTELQAINDYALQKTPTVSSTFTGFPAGNATDGDGTTRWSSAASGGTEWFKVDLGQNQTVSGVNIDWSIHYATNYTIEVSTDDVNYTTVFTKTGNVSTNITNSFPTTSARYVRITMTSGNAANYSFYDFSVF